MRGRRDYAPARTAAAPLVAVVLQLPPPAGQQSRATRAQPREQQASVPQRAASPWAAMRAARRRQPSLTWMPPALQRSCAPASARRAPLRTTSRGASPWRTPASRSAWQRSRIHVKRRCEQSLSANDRTHHCSASACSGWQASLAGMRDDAVAEACATDASGAVPPGPWFSRGLECRSVACGTLPADRISDYGRAKSSAADAASRTSSSRRLRSDGACAAGAAAGASASSNSSSS
jgi:hypothetical protein